MTETVATTAEITGTIERLEHGCPNCGNPWEEPNPNPINVIWFQEPEKNKTGLELCPDCVFWPRKIVKKRIITTLRRLGWPRTKLWAFGIGLEKHLREPPVVYS